MSMGKAIQWLTKILKDGQTKQVARVVGRATGQYIKISRRCNSCKADKDHYEHQDTDGNTHYFCGTCDTHN